MKSDMFHEHVGCANDMSAGVQIACETTFCANYLMCTDTKHVRLFGHAYTDTMCVCLGISFDSYAFLLVFLSSLAHF